MLFSNRDPASKTQATEVNPDSITFHTGDNLGEYLWRLAHPDLPIPFPAYNTKEWKRWRASFSKQHPKLRKWFSIWVVGSMSYWCYLGYDWLSNREQVPVTGRWRYSRYDHSLHDPERANMADELRRESFCQPADSVETRESTRVLETLLRTTTLEDLHWEIIVLNSGPGMFIDFLVYGETRYVARTSQ